MRDTSSSGTWVFCLIRSCRLSSIFHRWFWMLLGYMASWLGIAGISPRWTLLKYYNAVIQSRLKYAKVVLSPMYECYSRKLDSAQRRFTKFPLFNTDREYPNQGCDIAVLCMRKGYLILEMRRIIASISSLFEVVHYDVNCSEILSKINFNVPSYISRTVHHFKQDRARTNILQKARNIKMCENFTSFIFSHQGIIWLI